MSWFVVGVIFGIGIGFLLRPLLDWWIAWHDYRRAAAHIELSDRRFDSVVDSYEKSRVGS
jgi:hypothetical protein